MQYAMKSGFQFHYLYRTGETDPECVTFLLNVWNIEDVVKQQLQNSLCIASAKDGLLSQSDLLLVLNDANRQSDWMIHSHF